MKIKQLFNVLLAVALFAALGVHAKSAPNNDTATFATGCFWCGEAKFSQLKGVIKVTSGYTGGRIADPRYSLVSTGTTGHAEAFNVIYDSTVITYDELLEAFFLSHDPTELNRQGNDVGTQYRSAIFYHNDAQKERAAYYLNKFTEQHIYPKPIVTELTRFTVFYEAETYHQQYYKKHPTQDYCRYVIQPELEKFKLIFKDKLKQ
ncbi:peptide-methionine (S)-S-oxide reductase MsrA [Chitinophaga pinensis]|uniref:Peptide methionine sulfoxide reductase MsrA n=1 Tax=Chitinophaga pinensis (strain ATCC 43595 / DSM 2588 / LMG 13176 / NBRC 15968 / NCIMB 11800 / UQM 2034) TaxID=485918 RepID=A0A979GXA2_CHIPD|nr:peptide-methionine (S)-S-oxide reductase MsrA [Chitinophaga pinensis]ACU64518.1 peptide methionine sulfoxide reductase [Chitinophaga pinensis DSM 2588]